MNDNPRLLHTMLRIRSLEITLDFYLSKLGMRLFRREDYPQGRFTLIFLGYGDEDSSAVLEFTYNWDVPDYVTGTGYGHIAIGVSDIYSFCENIEKKNVKVTRRPGPMKFSNSDSPEIIAFIEDPDGYKIELIEKPNLKLKTQ